jgi:hypothetical protein
MLRCLNKAARCTPKNEKNADEADYMVVKQRDVHPCKRN